MGPAFIFQITDLTKKFGQRELLKNVNIAFYPGAKIGLLGRNGAGKSTLMKIMAGLDTEYDGETRLADGYTVGYLRQEPQLDPEKTVFENVMEAVDHSRAVLRRFEEINARLGEPLDDAADLVRLAQQFQVPGAAGLTEAALVQALIDGHWDHVEREFDGWPFDAALDDLQDDAEDDLERVLERHVHTPIVALGVGWRFQ